MFKKTINYQDFNGGSRREDLYFNLTDDELLTFRVQELDALQGDLEGLKSKDPETITPEDIFKILKWLKLVMYASYGVKSEDGRFFRKEEQALRDFKSSAIHDALLLQLFENDGKGAMEFLEALILRKVREGAVQTDPRPVITTTGGVDYIPGQAAVDPSYEEFLRWRANNTPESE